VLFIAAAVVFVAGCSEQQPVIIKYQGEWTGNITKTVVTHDGENSTYYGRVMEVRDLEGDDMVIFLDNYSLRCYPVKSNDWVPGEMHTVYTEDTFAGTSQYIKSVKIEGY